MDGPKGEDGESPSLTRNCNSDKILQHLESQDARLDRIRTSLRGNGAGPVDQTQKPHKQSSRTQVRELCLCGYHKGDTMLAILNVTRITKLPNRYK